MFEQYNIFQKAVRIIVFVALTYLSLMYLPNQEIVLEDKIKLVLAMTAVFLIYDLYYPAVRIELTNEKNDNNY